MGHSIDCPLLSLPALKRQGFSEVPDDAPVIKDPLFNVYP